MLYVLYAEVSPFLDLNLISWHSYLPMCGVSRNTMKELLSYVGTYTHGIEYLDEQSDCPLC